MVDSQQNIKGNLSFGMKPTRQEVLIDNYRESREEGIGLVRSSFDDIKLIGGVLAAILSGQWLTGEPRLLLIIPAALAGFLIYAVQKFKASSLITSYMIYLEGEINKDYHAPIMLWNRQIIGKRISVGRESPSGDFLLWIVIVIATGIYMWICVWVVIENPIYFGEAPYIIWTYSISLGVIYLIALAMLRNTIRDIKDLSPEMISKLALKEERVFSSHEERESPSSNDA